MSRLNSEQRRRLPSSDFVFPKRREYPINDFGHAMIAIAYVDKYGTREEKERVYAAVRAKYPSLHIHPQLNRKAPYGSHRRQ